MAKILGIDLGTTNSAIAVVKSGEPEIIENAEGARTTPSVVAISKTGERLVGLLARRQAVTNPKNTIYQIKRFIGHSFDEAAVAKDRSAVAFETQKSANGGPGGQDGRQVVPAGRGLGDDIAEIEAGCRGTAGRDHYGGRHHSA